MRNPLSIEEFANWCEKQPADRAYTYNDPLVCACGQYSSDIGLPDLEWVDREIDGNRFWLSANGLANKAPRTFGALASRLRASLKEQEQGR